MESLTANPFKFGDPVEGDYYLPRPELSSNIRQFLENRIHIVLMGPRRFGKTSFVLNLLNQLRRDGYSCLFVDIFNITSHRDFLNQLLRAVRAQKSFRGIIQFWLHKFKQLSPQVSAEVDHVTGNPSFSFTIDPDCYLSAEQIRVLFL